MHTPPNIIAKQHHTASKNYGEYSGMFFGRRGSPQLFKPHQPLLGNAPQTLEKAIPAQWERECG